mgnify:CR=1 FL=1
MSDRPRVSLAPGVLADGQLSQMLRDNLIQYPTARQPQVRPDPSALDLTLGTKAWKLKTSSRPTTRELEKIKRESDEQAPGTDAYGQYFHFEAKAIYLVQLQETLTLPPNLCGRGTGKSSVGRLDVITRLLTEHAQEYDTVPEDYDGNLYLLVSPQTFNISVAPGSSLNQLRLVCGPQHAAVIDRHIIGHYGQPFWYVLKPGKVDEYVDWERSLEPAESLVADPRLFDLTVDLADPHHPFIYKAKEPPSNRQASTIDLRENVYSTLERGGYNPAEFFERIPVQREGADYFVELAPQSFYIMKSKERLHIPVDVAVEVIAISERIGDIRIHYAGFAHPGFGTQRDDNRKGTPLIFEVRATDMPTKLFDGSLLARMQLFRMSQPAKPENTVYGSQELKLSKVFAEWPEG